jgi:hypothetical protein
VIRQRSECLDLCHGRNIGVGQGSQKTRSHYSALMRSIPALARLSTNLPELLAPAPSLLRRPAD